MAFILTLGCLFLIHIYNLYQLVGPSLKFEWNRLVSPRFEWTLKFERSPRMEGITLRSPRISASPIFEGGHIPGTSVTMLVEVISSSMCDRTLKNLVVHMNTKQYILKTHSLTSLRYRNFCKIIKFSSIILTFYVPINLIMVPPNTDSNNVIFELGIEHQETLNYLSPICDIVCEITYFTSMFHVQRFKFRSICYKRWIYSIFYVAHWGSSRL